MTSKIDDETALDRLNEMALTPMQRITLIGFLESCSQNTIENTSYLEMMRWYALSGHNLLGLSESISTYKIREGTSSLINAMMSDANTDVRLSTKVVKIYQDKKGVSVLTENGNLIEAKHALVTVPINTLNQIEFHCIRILHDKISERH